MEKSRHQEFHLMEYWHILRKRRWVVLTSVAVLFTVVTIGSFLITPTFRATAVLQIEREKQNIANFNDIFARDTSSIAYTDFYRTQYRLIRSREVLRRVGERMDLPNEPAMIAAGAPGLVGRIRDWAAGLLPGEGVASEPLDPWLPWIELLEKKIQVEPVKNTHLVEISFVSADPALAAGIPNAIAGEYIYFNTEVKSRTTGIAGEKLDVEIGSLSEEIGRLEADLRALGEEKSIVDLGNKKNLAFSTLEELTRSTTAARIDRARREAAFESVRRADPTSLESVRSSATIKDLKNRLSELERQHAEKQSLFKPDYPDMVSLRSQIDLVRGQLEEETQQIRDQVVQSTETAFLTSQGEEERLAVMERTQRDRVHELERSLADYETRHAALEAKRDMRAGLIKRRDETGVLNRMDDIQSGNVWLVESAQVPVIPHRPNKKVNILLSLVLGAGLGIGLAFFFEYLDNSIKSADDMERLSGLPTLGLIPGLRHRGHGKLVALDSGGRTVGVECITHDAPKSNVAEAYRDLRTTLLLSSPDHPPKILMITSSQPREGKTVTALNVGISLTQVGKKVLVMDADLRKPRLHKPLGLTRATGLTNGLTGSARWPDLIQSTSIPLLSILTAGPIPPNPAELLASQSFARLLQELRQSKQFDHVVVDTPPLLAVADPVIVSEHVDGVLMVVQAGETPYQTVQAGLDKLRSSKARVLGAVLNSVDLSEQDYYSYRYGYRYGYYSHSDSEMEPGDDRAAGKDSGAAPIQEAGGGGRLARH